MKWTPQQDEFLTQNYGRLTAHECAMELAVSGLTRGSVIGRASRLGLMSNRSGERSKHTRPRSSKQRPASSIPVTPGKVGLAATSVGGAGMFKVVSMRDASIDVPDYQCRMVPDIVALEPYQCRWPLDAGGFCGNDQYRGLNHKDTSYCLTHMCKSINSREYAGGYWATRK